MAKRGNNNKNKVTNKIIGNRLSSKSKFQELNDDGSVKYTDKFLENSRRKMEPINMASARGNELLAQEEKHVTNIMHVRGEQLKQLKDLSYTYNNIFSTQQKQTEAVEQLYGIQNKLADKLQLAASSAQEIATAQRATRDMSLAELNTNQRTKSDLSSINRLKMSALDSAQKLTLYNKQNIPYFNKINKMQAEIAVLTEKVGNNVGTENAYRLETLKTMVDQYKSLGKLEKRNTRTSEIQDSINDLMTMQGTAAGRIFKKLKDIVTNPLLIFTGLLALGVSRFETMRQRGNQLAEEVDRVNKKLAGAGPYQEAIIRRAKTINLTFRAAGEGFSSSLEGAVDAVQSLEKQLGMIGSVSSNLVKLMSTIKLSINLSDEQAAKVIDTYLTVGDHSEKAAENSANMLYSLSEQAGLNPAETFKEIANATGESLAFIKGGTAELNNTVIAAKKLGLSLEDVATISRGLLDFESSIEAEMEARMLTGMNINFNKARAFAMNKEGAKAAKEVMRQVGGLERFQSMNIFQQEAVAKATGLSVDELLKTNVQRERQKQIAKDKQQIHEDTAKMLPIVTNVMGKLETGMSAIDKIATILGDIVLNVFGVDFAQAEKLILSFVKSDTFQTGLKNVLFFMKGVIEGIIDAVSTVWDFLKKLPWLGDLVKNMGSMDMSGGFGGAQKSGKTVGKAVAYGYIAKKVLGLTPFTAMWVRSAAGAFAGLGSSIADGIKGLFGYGGQASAGAGGLAGGATTAGWLAAGAFIAKGVYDVATLSGRNTRSEKAGAIGGAVGAIGGAKIGAAVGTAIFPGVGTAIGAGIGAAAGYFGGDMIKHFGIFQDDLDKSRIKLADSEMRIGLEATKQNNKLQMDVVVAQNKVRSSFVQFGLTTDGASKNEIHSFADAMLSAGNITKTTHKDAISGSMSAVELLESAAAGAAGNLTREQEARKVWVENQMKTDDINRYNRLQYNKELYTTIESLSNDMIDNQITESGMDKRGKIDYLLNPLRTEHDREVIAREMFRLYKGTVPMQKIKSAVERATQGVDFYVTKTDAVESGLEALRDQLLQDVELLIDDDTRLYNIKKTKLMQKSADMEYDPVTKGLIVTPKDDPNKSTMRRGGVTNKFAKGGITGANVPVPADFSGGSTMQTIEAHMSKLMDAAFGDYTNYWVSKTEDFGGGPIPMGLGGVGDPAVNTSSYFGGKDINTGNLQQTQAGQKVVADWVKEFGMPKVEGDTGWPGYHEFSGGTAMWGINNLMKEGNFTGGGIPQSVRNKLGKGYGKKLRDKKDRLRKKDKDWKDSGWFGDPLIGEKPSREAKYAKRDDMKSPLAPTRVNDVMAAMNPVVEGVYTGQRAGAPFAAAIVAAAAIGAMGGGLGSTLLRGGGNLVRTGIQANIGLIQSGIARIGISQGLWSSVIGAMQTYGGARGITAMVGSMRDIISGEADLKDLTNVFLGGASATIKKVKNTSTSVYHAYKGIKTGDASHYVKAVLPWISDRALVGTPLGKIIYHTGGYSNAAKDVTKFTKDLTKYILSGDLTKDGVWVKGGSAMSELFGSIKSWFNSGDEGSEIISSAALATGMGIDQLLTEAVYGAANSSAQAILAAKAGQKDGESSEAGGITKEFGSLFGEKGGVKPTKVNDMLLSADGQLIETQEDDNLIANAGKIIQTKGGGGTNKDADLINSLLRELIIVSSDTVVEVDGRVVSDNLQLT